MQEAKEIEAAVITARKWLSELEKANYHNLALGDLNNDGHQEMVLIDGNQNLMEILMLP